MVGERIESGEGTTEVIPQLGDEELKLELLGELELQVLVVGCANTCCCCCT